MIEPTGTVAGDPSILHDHVLPVICGTSLTGVAATLALAGLIGSAAHCAGMCGPFVLAQQDAGNGRLTGMRLVRAATLPYHLGRMTTYTLLGALFGGAGNTLVQVTRLAPLFSGFLLLAALMFLLQALSSLGFGIRFGSAGWLAGRLPRLIGRLLRGGSDGPWASGGGRGYGLGVALGFLPCGFLYGALLAAAGTGSPAGGALAMAGFCAGTIPSLILVGCGAGALAARQRRWARTLLAPLQLGTAATLVFFALGA